MAGAFHSFTFDSLVLIHKEFCLGNYIDYRKSHFQHDMYVMFRK